MNLYERFVAAWAALTGATIASEGEKPELTEENVATLEAAATKVEALETENTTLKDENQTHATRITELAGELETANDATAHAAAAVTPILEALENNNVEVAEGTDPVAVAVETINAWGKMAPNATATPVSTADAIPSAKKEDSTLTQFDIEAQERYNAQQAN